MLISYIWKRRFQYICKNLPYRVVQKDLPTKNSNKNNTRRRMKKCFYKTLQEFSQNIMSRPNFESAAFCFDEYSETGFHWCARPTHQFSIQLGPSWLNDCLQGVQVGVLTSWNIPFQNIPDSKVHGIYIRAVGCPHLFVPKSSWFGPALPHWQPKAQGPLCEMKHRHVWRFICSQNFLWAKEELFSVTCSNKLGCWLWSPHQGKINEICLRLMQLRPKTDCKHVSWV